MPLCHLLEICFIMNISGGVPSIFTARVREKFQCPIYNLKFWRPEKYLGVKKKHRQLQKPAFPSSFLFSKQKKNLRQLQKSEFLSLFVCTLKGTSFIAPECCRPGVVHPWAGTPLYIAINRKVFSVSILLHKILQYSGCVMSSMSGFRYYPSMCDN